MKKVSKRTLKNLSGVNSKLALIVGMVLARDKVDLTIISGFRTAQKQNKIFLDGRSQLDGYNKISYHQTGNAIDFIPYPFVINDWRDVNKFVLIGQELKLAAKHLGFNYSYGGDWKTFKDYGHFELHEK